MTFDPPGAGNQAEEGTTVLGPNLQGRRWDTTLTRTKWFTPFCAIPTAPSRRLRLRCVRYQPPRGLSWPRALRNQPSWGDRGSLRGHQRQLCGARLHTLPDGKFTTFAVPGSSMKTGQGTLPTTFSGLWGRSRGCTTRIISSTDSCQIPTAPVSNSKLTARTPPRVTSTASSRQILVCSRRSREVTQTNHGFVRSPVGTFATFDAPGAGTGAFQGTVAISNNLFGALTCVKNWVTKR